MYTHSPAATDPTTADPATDDAGGTDSTASGERTALVVLDPAYPEATLRAALAHPDAAGTVHLLTVFPTAEYEARRRDRAAAGVIAPYTVSHLETEARRLARRAGRRWLGTPGVDFEAFGAVGSTRDRVLAAVAERGYDRVFVAAPQRTIWQRLLGRADLSTAIARVLPTVVTVVPVRDGTLPGLDRADGSLGAESVVDTSMVTEDSPPVIED